MIIDAHLHLDEFVDGTALGAARELNRQLEEAGVDRGIVLHLDTQPWTCEETAEALAQYPRLNGFINVHPYRENALSELQRGILELGYIGLKLHPRLQEFGLLDERTINLVKASGEMDVPVLIDAFPDGTHLMQGFSPLNYSLLAVACPQTKIVWAHMGGHYVLDFMMLAKRLPNVYMDVSYSLLYYNDSPTVDNMIYAMRSMKFDRIFYGSDYPDRSINNTLKLSIEILKSRGVSDNELEKIFETNALGFFKWTEKKEK